MNTSRGVLVLAAAMVTGLAVGSLAAENGNTNEPTAVTAPAQPADTQQQKPRKPRLTLKPNASVFWPSSEKAKDTFGDSWKMIGIAIDYRDDDRSKSRFQLQIDGIARSSGPDHVRVFPVGVKFTQRLNTSRHFSPYYGATASWCIADVKSTADNVDTGLRSAGPGGSAFVGINVGMNLKLEATYHVFPTIKDFDLSGLSIGGTLQF